MPASGHQNRDRKGADILVFFAGYTKRTPRSGLGREERRKQLTGPAAKRGIAQSRHRSLIEVHFDHAGAGGLGERDQASRGIDHSGSSDEQEDIAGPGGLLGRLPYIGRQGLPEPDDTGTGHRSAGTSWRQFVERGIEIAPDLPAAGTAKKPDVAVNLQYMTAARAVVQTVDILSNQGEPLFPPFEVGEGKVAGIRGDRGDLLPSPVIPFPNQHRIAGERLGSRQIFRAELTPQPFRSTKRRHPALGGDSRAGEHGYRTCVANPFPGLVHESIVAQAAGIEKPDRGNNLSGIASDKRVGGLS